MVGKLRKQCWLDRHLENEVRLTQETKDLDKQLKACQKDLFDINEFLLNELKVTRAPWQFVPDRA